MTGSNREGNNVPLYTSLPNNVLAWLDSADVSQQFSSAVDVADRTIAEFTKEREVRPEDLHQPITL